MTSAIIASLFAVLSTATLCFYALKIGNKFQLLDVPGARKKHKNVTPLMGGVVLIGAFIPASILYLILMHPAPEQVTIIVWLVAILAMTLIGIADDRHSLSPTARLIFSFAVFSIIAFAEPHFNVRALAFETPQFSLGFGVKAVSVAFTLICCVGLVNAVNMADGKNGLVIGLCIGWLALLSVKASSSFLPFIALLAIVLIILLVFNLKSALFLGDGGAYGFATSIALLSIAIYNSFDASGHRLIYADGIALLFLVPVVDSFRLIFHRLKKGQSPMSGDRDHLHHYLQDKLGWPLGLFIYWAIALIPAALWWTLF